MDDSEGDIDETECHSIHDQRLIIDISLKRFVHDILLEDWDVDYWQQAVCADVGPLEEESKGQEWE